MTNIDEMIGEIEAYLACPMKGVEPFWEYKERRWLHELLEQLKEKKGNGKPAHTA